MLSTDPIDIPLDDDGDLDLVAFAARVLTSGKSGILQACKIALGFVRGQYFADLDRGVDWNGKILGRKYRAKTIADECTRVLLTVPGVLSVASVNLSFDKRTRTVTGAFRVDTVFGDSGEQTL